MGSYDGVVTFADHDVPVVVELDDEHVRLSASGTEIGDWAADECRIVHIGDATYTITAEDETLEFVPSQPMLFAAAVNGGAVGEPAIVAPDEETAATPEHTTEEAPPPSTTTMALFYALCVVTAGLGVWALIRIIL